MRNLPYILFAILMTEAVFTNAQSKSELEASIVKLTAHNDPLQKQVNALTQQNADYDKLIDTLSVLTGVHMDQLDTVRTVMELRAAAQVAESDSLTKARSMAAALQLTKESLGKDVARLRTDSLNMADQLRTAVAAQSPATAAPAMSTTDQLMKLSGMMDQGLISKEEFLRLKGELMAK